MFYNYLKSIYKSLKNYDPIYKSHDLDNLNKLNDYSNSHLGTSIGGNYGLETIIQTNNKILNGLVKYQIMNDVNFPNNEYIPLIGGNINTEFLKAKDDADKSLQDLITKINKLELDKIIKAINFIVNYINTLDRELSSTDISKLRGQLEELNEMLKTYTEK